jgi:hypothetical protein
MTEAMDMDGRLDQLVRAGLMPTSSLPLLKRAISRMHAGMSLQGAERDVMNMFINSMMFIVLGDDTVFNKARAGAKSYAAEEVELDENAPIVAHLTKRYGDNIRKSHVMSAAKDFGVDPSKLSKAVRKKLGKSMLDEAKEKQEYDYEGDMAMNAQKNEEVEVIDELSKKTMGSYVKKASGAEQPKNVMSPKNVPLTKIAAYQGDSETGHFGSRFNQATYDKAERLRKNRETGIKRAVDKLAKEEVEITEASVADVAKTAHLHVRAGKHDSIHTAIQSAVNTHFPSSVHSAVTRKKVAAQALNKIQSMNKSKMTKEEVEQVDEISKAMAGRYINKAKNSIDLTAWRQGYKEAGAGSPSKHMEKKLSKRHKGIETAVKKLTKEESEQIDENQQYVEITNAHHGGKSYIPVHPTQAYAALNHYNSFSHNKKVRIIDQKQHDAIHAAKTAVKEELDFNEAFEQIDELSKKTLGSYVNKAAERIGTKGVSAGLRIAADEKSSGNFKDMGKRQKGISRAVNKLTKEDIDAVKQMNESYKTAFETALNEYGIKSPSELDESKRKEFFNHVDLEFKKGDN